MNSNNKKIHANRDIKRVPCFAHEMQGMSVMRTQWKINILKNVKRQNLGTLFIYIIYFFDRTKMSWSEKWFLKWLEPKKCWNNNRLKILAQYCIRFNYQHWYYTGLQYQPNTMRKKWHPTDCHPTNTDVGTIIDQVVHVPLCTGIIRIRLGFSFFLPLVKFKKKRKQRIKHVIPWSVQFS